MSVLQPDLMKCVVPTIMVGIIAIQSSTFWRDSPPDIVFYLLPNQIYSLIVLVLISGNCELLVLVSSLYPVSVLSD